MSSRPAPSDRDAHVAAHVFDFREIADYVVEHEDTATAANALRNAQDEIDRLRDALGDLLVHIPNGGVWSVLRRYKEAGYAALNRK